MLFLAVAQLVCGQLPLKKKNNKNVDKVTAAGGLPKSNHQTYPNRLDGYYEK